MSQTAKRESTCVREDVHGVLRVGISRVPFAAVVAQVNLGHTPLVILSDYPTLSLSDVEAAISYYLQNQNQLDRKLAEEELMLERTSEPTRAALSGENSRFLRELQVQSRR